MLDSKAVRLPAQRGAKVTFTLDGRSVEAHAGEMLAASLMAAGIFRLRRSPAKGGARGAFCFMGACQECVVHVDGRLRQSCLVTVEQGLRVETSGASRAGA